MMKIKPIDQAVNAYKVQDMRGGFTIHNDKVIELRDTNGILHLPIDTPESIMDFDRARYDLDTSTGYPIKIAFGARYCIGFSQDDWNNNFTATKCKDHFIYNDFGNYKPIDPEYSLVSGKTVRDMLVAVINHNYPSIGMYDGFKEFKLEFFDDTPWRDLTFDDVMEMWDSYDASLDYDDFASGNDGHAVMNSDHPLSGFVKPNFQIYDITGHNQGQYAHVVVFDDLLEVFGEGVDFNNMFTNYFYRAPVYGVLIVGDREFTVDEYLTDGYEWGESDFLTNLFKHESFNQSIKTLIEEIINQHGDLNYE